MARHGVLQYIPAIDAFGVVTDAATDASVAPMAMLTSAAASADRSLMPSPQKSVVHCKPYITWALGQCITWALGQCITWALGHCITWALGHCITWALGYCNTLYLDTASHGHLDTASHGHLDTATHGYMDPASHGDLDTASHGHLDTASHGHLDTASHGHLDTASHGHVDTALKMNSRPDLHLFFGRPHIRYKQISAAQPSPAQPKNCLLMIT